jgi:hypothetical protein
VEKCTIRHSFGPIRHLGSPVAALMGDEMGDSALLMDDTLWLSREPSKKHAVFSPLKNPKILCNPFNVINLRRKKARSQRLPRADFLDFPPCPSDQMDVCLDQLNQRQVRPHMIYTTIGLPC